MKYNSISLIARIRENANKFIVNELEKNGIQNVVPSHGDIMAVLFSIEKCTMKELAQKIHRTKATLTVLVDKLIALNLVEREKSIEDNRVTYIKLTSEGLKFRPIFKQISAGLNSIVYKGLSEDEANTLEHLLEKINTNLK